MFRIRRRRRRWRAWFIVLRDAPARLRGASEGSFDLSCWTNAHFHLRKWLATRHGRSQRTAFVLRRQLRAAAASICTSLTYSSPSIFLFLSPFYLCFLQYVPLLPLHKPARTSPICLYRPALFPPAVSSCSRFFHFVFFFSAVLLLSFHIYSLRQQL